MALDIRKLPLARGQVIDYYKKYNLRRTTGYNRLILKMVRKIKQVPAERPIPTELMVALRIFLDPTLKKYYDHCLHNPARFRRLQALVARKQAQFRDDAAKKPIARKTLQHFTFWKLAWSEYVMLILALDFLYFGLGSRKAGKTLDPLPLRYTVPLARFQFFFIYGIPLMLIGLSHYFQYIALLIAVVRALKFYPQVKVDYYRYAIEGTQSEFGFDFEMNVKNVVGIKKSE